MIHKLTLQSIISKYYLNGTVEAVKWVIKDENLTIRFMSPNKDMLGELTYSGFKSTNNEIAIYNTSQLNKLLSIMSGNVMLSVSKSGGVNTHLMIGDTQFNSIYALADTLLIGKVAKAEEPSEYTSTSTIDIEQITALIKAKSALPDTTVVNISTENNINGDNVLRFTIGEKSSYSNLIQYDIATQSNGTFDIPFNANILKEILVANKDQESGTIEISKDGLIKLSFESEDKTLKSTYFMVRNQE
jgi:hypothetical protein